MPNKKYTIAKNNQNFIAKNNQNFGMNSLKLSTTVPRQIEFCFCYRQRVLKLYFLSISKHTLGRTSERAPNLFAISSHFIKEHF